QKISRRSKLLLTRARTRRYLPASHLPPQVLSRFFRAKTRLDRLREMQLRLICGAAGRLRPRGVDLPPIQREAEHHCWSADARDNMRYRRIALKAPVPFMCGCIALGLTLSATRLQAAAPSALWLTTTATWGQADGSARRASEDLLREARSAIKRGDYDR